MLGAHSVYVASGGVKVVVEAATKVAVASMVYKVLVLSVTTSTSVVVVKRTVVTIVGDVRVSVVVVEGVEAVIVERVAPTHEQALE